MITLRIDPEFQALIPPLREEERAALEASLVRDGCRDALVVWTPEGDSVPVLLDGHTRYAICQAHGLACSLTDAPAWVVTHEDAKRWIIRNQLGRRNLEAYLRAELALQLEALIAAQAKARERQGGKDKGLMNSANPVHTRTQLAQAAGVSEDTIRKVKVIHQEADEPTKEALRRGQRRIHGVYQELRRPRTAVTQPPVLDTLSEPTTAPGHTHGERREETRHDHGADGASQGMIAHQLVDLADTSLQVMAQWRRRFPEDLSIHAFGLIERHLRDLQRYFHTKLMDISEDAASDEASVAGRRR
jgi:hypothetical protein